MHTLELTDIEEMEPLLDIDFNGRHFDLHNYYKFREIKIDDDSIEFLFEYSGEKDMINDRSVAIIFKRILESNAAEHVKNFVQNDCIMNFARGMFTEKSSYYGIEKARYFFIGFLEVELIDIVCEEAKIVIW